MLSGTEVLFVTTVFIQSLLINLAANFLSILSHSFSVSCFQASNQVNSPSCITWCLRDRVCITILATVIRCEDGTDDRHKCRLARNAFTNDLGNFLYIFIVNCSRKLDRKNDRWWSTRFVWFIRVCAENRIK